MKNEFYRSFIMSLPDSLKKDVALVLLQHRGQDLAIPRARLVGMFASKYPKIRDIDRAIRIAISQLRDDHWMIGMSHSGDGYFIVTSMDEFEKFISDYTDRAYTVIEKSKRMRETALQVFGVKKPTQMSLID
jgi:hypothetical protein